MSSVSDLAHTEPMQASFDIVRAAYVELWVKDLTESEHFYVDLLGMIVSARTADTLYLRAWEERQHHSLILRQASSPAVSRLGFRVRRDADLESLERFAASRGLATKWREAGADPGAGRTLQVWDPFGYPLDFAYEMETCEPQHQRFDLHKGAPLLRFEHLNLHSPDVESAFRWWLELGFRCSEYISTDEPATERITGAWLFRKPSVHDLALTAGRGPRMHHFAYWVAEPAGVLRACDQLAGANRADVIERGPGRHGVSNAFFVYLRDPDGHRIGLYSSDYYTGDPDLAPIRWSVTDRRCRSFWGTAAPDSWYEQSSVLIGPDGAPSQTHGANVDEREQRSQIFA